MVLMGGHRAGRSDGYSLCHHCGRGGSPVMRMTKPLALLTGVVMAAVVGIGVNGTANASSTGMGNAPTAVGASSAVVDPTVLRVTGTLADGTGVVEGIVDLQRFTGKNRT